jgi:hypothetical protein
LTWHSESKARKQRMSTGGVMCMRVSLTQRPDSNDHLQSVRPGRGLWRDYGYCCQELCQDASSAVISSSTILMRLQNCVRATQICSCARWKVSGRLWIDLIVWLKTNNSAIVCLHSLQSNLTGSFVVTFTLHLHRAFQSKIPMQQ